MNSDIVVNYKNHKKKILLDYCKILEQIISLEKNTMWKNSKEFTNICRGILEFFVEKNYFDNNYDRENPIEYLNSISNGILSNIVEYRQSNDKASLSDGKSETFLLSVIIGSASYVDALANIVDGDYSKLRSKLIILLKHLSKTNFLKTNIDDKVLIDRLYEELKKNYLDEEHFFELFEELENHNTYQLINKLYNYYVVKFVYKVPNVEKYDKDVVDKYNGMYKDKFLAVSYDLLVVLLLKENLLNKKINTYLIPLPSVLSSKVLKKLNEPAIMNHIKFLVPLEAKNEKKKTVDKLKGLGFKIIYYYNGIDSKVFEDLGNIDVLCKKSFFDIYKDSIDNWRSKGINIVRTDISMESSEDAILGKKEV